MVCWAKESLSTVRVLIKNQKRTEALFFGHLALEKMLKALCAVRCVPKVKIWGHNLQILAERADLWRHLDATQKRELTTIDTFNIEGRYDDDNRKFKTLCTPQYTLHWFHIIVNWCKFIESIILKERVNLPNNTPAL